MYINGVKCDASTEKRKSLKLYQVVLKNMKDS